MSLLQIPSIFFTFSSKSLRLVAQLKDLGLAAVLITRTVRMTSSYNHYLLPLQQVSDFGVEQ